MKMTFTRNSLSIGVMERTFQEIVGLLLCETSRVWYAVLNVCLDHKERATSPPYFRDFLEKY